MSKYFLLSIFYTVFAVKQGVTQQPTNSDPSKNYVNVNTPKTPESAAFEKYGDVQVNEFTGTTNVAIPIYTLQSRLLSVPITLSYQANGIRVNQEASWVGLGFDLLAGGRVTVETKGNTDFSVIGAVAPYTQTAMTQIFNRLGNHGENAVLTPATFWDPPPPCVGCPVDPNLYNGQGISDMTQFGSGEPDIFRANFNGQSVTFYIDKISNTLKFLGERSNFKITYTLNSSNQVTAWSIIDNEGITYNFNQTETTTNTYGNSPVVPSSSTSAWLLTEMIHPTGDNILFTYANYGYSVPAFNMSGSYDIVSGVPTVGDNQFQNISMQSPYYLAKIESHNVAVDFVLDTRTDLYGPGSRKLVQVKVTDKSSNVVKKKVSFNYSYFQGTANTNIHSYLNTLFYTLPSPLTTSGYLATSTTRLKLDSVNVNDNIAQPPYRFYYNSQVPDKYSFSQDHWGYYNGVQNHTTSGTNYFTRLIPYNGFRGVQGYQPPGGLSNIVQNLGDSRDCGPTYSQAMILDSVVYPTGGSSKFTYEPHQSTMLPNLNLTGGGLRVKSVKNYTHGTVAGIKEYTYSNGKYLGTINYATTANVLAYCMSTDQSVPWFRGHFKYSSDGAINFNDILIGYWQIIVVQKDAAGVTNGSVQKTFNLSAPSSNYAGGVGFDVQPPYFSPGLPPTFPPEPTIGPLGMDYIAWLDPQHKNLPPTPSTCLEGKLMEEKYFDVSNNLLKSVNYYYSLANYTNDYYNIKAIQNREGGFTGNCGQGIAPQFGWGSGGLRPVNLFVSPAKAFHAITDSVVEVTYQGANTLVQKKSFTYDSKYQVSSETTTNSDNSIQKVSYTRPYDYLITGINGSTSLVYEMSARNLNSTIFSTTVRRNGTQIDSVFNLYHKPFNNVYVPQNTQIKVGANPMETRQVYNAYDTYGHLLERQKPGGVKENYVWGYNKQFPVASVIGSDYATIAGIVDANILGNPSSDVALRNELNKLRTQLPNAFVTTYTYDPAYGITSETDPTGKIKYYDYDGLGRLVMIRDKDYNILKKICYNYAGQAENCSMWGNQQLVQTFMRSNSVCATDYAGTQGTYTVTANKHFSAISLADANAKAQSDMNLNGQNYVNTNPASGATCIPMVKSTNTGTVPYTVNFTNTATSVVSTFSSNPMTSLQQVGQLPTGTYNVQFVPNVTATSQITIGGTTQTGGTLTFNNVVVSGPISFTINPYTLGSCSISMFPTYTTPTNSFGNDGTNTYFYIAFYSSNNMTAGNTYMIGTISTNCRPSSNRTIPNYVISGRTWTITILSSGQMQWYLHPGSSTVLANTTISTSTLNYPL